MKFPFKINKQPTEIEKRVVALETQLKDTSEKAGILVGNFFDADKELTPEADYVTYKKVKQKDGSERVQLAEASSFSSFSMEGMLESGFTNVSKYWEYYKATGVLRKCINLIASFTARAGFETTIKCIDDKDNPEDPEYLEVKRKIDEVNRQVNMDHIIFVTQVKRYLYGMCAWQIVQGANTKKIMELQPLRSDYISPKVNDKGQFVGLEYYLATGGVIPKERILFFNLDALEISNTDLCGVSSIKSIEREIKIKKNLQRDLLYASRSLWAPIVIYQADTRGLTPAERNALFEALKGELKPGGVIVTNRAVESTVIQYSPDLNNLIRAIQIQDEEIIGNYGIPKALLSREKTIARATLEYSIKSFYESTISQDQAYLKRQLERQWYDPLVKSLGYGDRIRIHHEWRPILDPASDLIVALVRAYDSGVITGEEFFRRLGWELDRVSPDAEESAKKPEEEPEVPPPTKKPLIKKPKKVIKQNVK